MTSNTKAVFRNSKGQFVSVDPSTFVGIISRNEKGQVKTTKERFPSTVLSFHDAIAHDMASGVDHNPQIWDLTPDKDEEVM